MRCLLLVVQQLGFVGGDSESRISLEQFLRALAKAADHSVIARTEQEKRDLQAVALWIEDSRRRTGSSLAATFKMWDADADGFLDYEEFVSGCAACQGNADQASLPYVYTNDEFDELARTVDQAKTGRINYLSFLGLFSLAEGENVEFEIEMDQNGRERAVSVTGPEGDYVQGAPRPEPRYEDSY